MPYSFIRFPLAAASHNSMFFSAGVTYWAPAQGISLVTLMIESTVAWRPMASDAKCIRRGLSCQHAVGRAPEWPTGHSGACAHEQNDGALGRNGYVTLCGVVLGDPSGPLYLEVERST